MTREIRPDLLWPKAALEHYKRQEKIAREKAKRLQKCRERRKQKEATP